MKVPLVIVLAFIALSHASPAAKVNPTDDKRVLCYFESWAIYNNGQGKFEVKDLDPFVCTHLVYSFVGLGNDNKVKVLDPYADLEEDGGLGNMKKLTGLKKQNPTLKVLLAIGGWSEGSTKYSNMAASAANRKVFINSIVPFLQSQNFDGLDFDWEYPTERGGTPADKNNFDTLLSELRTAFTPHGFLLSAAIGAGEGLIKKAYNVANLGRILDFINVMTYDYHSEYDGYAHHHSPLYAHAQDAANGIADFNSDSTMKLLVSLGAPAEKLNLGIGCYGKGVTLTNQNNNGIYAAADGPIPGGSMLGTDGYWGYNEICAKVGPDNWTVVRLEGQITSPYAYKGKNWIGYDDPQSARIKGEYARAQGYGGVMTWAIDTDDFRGGCHGETFPIVRAMGRGINGN